MTSFNKPLIQFAHTSAVFVALAFKNKRQCLPHYKLPQSPQSNSFPDILFFCPSSSSTWQSKKKGSHYKMRKRSRVRKSTHLSFWSICIHPSHQISCLKHEFYISGHILWLQPQAISSYTLKLVDAPLPQSDGFLSFPL